MRDRVPLQSVDGCLTLINDAAMSGRAGSPVCQSSHEAGEEADADKAADASGRRPMLIYVNVFERRSFLN